MWALPRAEQPYTLNYPQLNTENEVQLVFDYSNQKAGGSKPPVHEHTTTTSDLVPIAQQSSSQFNVSGNIGGKNKASRYLPLKHANRVPTPQVDPSILNAHLGFNEELGNTTSKHESETLTRPDAAMKIYEPFTYMLPDDPLEFDTYLTEKVVVEHDIDEVDLAVLGLLATRYRVQMLPEVFEVIMSMLDLAAVLICLKMFPLERAAREARGLVTNVDNRRCAVCNWAECTDSNTIVFCDGCDVAVHQDCYGVHSIPEGRWLCRKCESGHGGDIKCVLCPHTSGAFKQTTGGEWIHLVCALWTPIVHVPENTSFLEPIRDLELMENGRWSLHCYVCRSKKRGACIQCSARDCYVAFHPTCAQAAGFFMTNCDHDFGEMLKQQEYLPVYCHRHSLQHAPQGFPQPNLDAARQALADEEILFKQQNVSLFANTRYNYWRTKSQALILPQTVVGAVKRSIKRRLNLDYDTDMIEFLCRYWTIKKDHNDGVMFNRRLHYALEVAQHRTIRAEQSEDLEYTPDELLNLVNSLLDTLKSGSSSQGEPHHQDTTKKLNSTVKRLDKIHEKASKNIKKGRTKTKEGITPQKHKAAESTKSIMRRRLPSTRRRVKEATSTVASVRKLRNRKSI